MATGSIFPIRKTKRNTDMCEKSLSAKEIQRRENSGGLNTSIESV